MKTEIDAHLVSLRPITAETVRAVTSLSVSESQKGFVAPNAISFAQARFQGRGIGKAALLRVIEHARSKGLFKVLRLSYVPGPGCPEPFYLGLGFLHTGEVDGNEVILELPLCSSTL